MSKKGRKIISGKKNHGRDNFYDNSGRNYDRRQPVYVEEDDIYFRNGRPVYEEEHIEEYGDYRTRHQNRRDDYDNRNRGHGRNDRGSKENRKSVSHGNLSKKNQNKESFERRVMADYEAALMSRDRRPFSLKYFAKNYSERDLAEYQYEIDKLHWLIDPHNRPKLIDKAEEVLRREFGPDATTRYGIPSKYRLSDIPQDSPSRSAERHVFTYNDDYLVGLRKSPKIPIGPWEVREDDKFSTIKTRKYLCMVDGEVLLGEMTIDTCHSHDSIKKDAKSGVKFCIYYRGLEEGKFIVERWDYEPLSLHPNKFDAQNNFCMNGVMCEKTKHSHRHIYNRFNRLVLTQNQSPDIKPTPINYKSKEYTADELRYDTFEDMIADFEKELHVERTQVPVHEVQTRKLKDLGKDYCVNYTTYSKITMPGPKYAELKAIEKAEAEAQENKNHDEEVDDLELRDDKDETGEEIDSQEQGIKGFTGTQLTFEEIYGCKLEDINANETQIKDVDGLDQVAIKFPNSEDKGKGKDKKIDPEQGGGQEL